MERLTKKNDSFTNDLYDQEIKIKQHLRKQLNLFRRAWLTDSGWKILIHDQDIDKHFNSVSIFDIRNKAKYLAKAVEVALEEFDTQSWATCCQKAIQLINNFENSDQLEIHNQDNFNQRWLITSPTTLMKWYRVYNHHNSQYFINPFTVSDKKKLPIFLDNNPDIREAIISFCNGNLLELSTITLQEFIIKKCLPQLLENRRAELNNPSLGMDFILKENNIKTVCRQTIAKWMNLLGYRYCERKKSYYCDSHEKPDNVAYRYKHIERYFERELQCNRWM